MIAVGGVSGVGLGGQAMGECRVAGELDERGSKWALPVYPVFEDKESGGSYEKIGQRKISQERPQISSMID